MRAAQLQAAPRQGQSDPIDAHLAVLTALQLDVERLPTPRADGDREALGVLLSARQDLTTGHTAKTNRLKALLLSGEDRDRQAARGALTDTVGPSWLGAGCQRAPAANKPFAKQRSVGSLSRCTKQRSNSRTTVSNCRTSSTTSPPEPPTATASGQSARPGHRQLLAPRTAPQRRRVRRPRRHQPARGEHRSNGRHRLDRSGDRALNRAIHTIAVTRMRSCARTRSYVERRTAEGKSQREIRRCLKRYIARELYRTLTTTITPSAPA